MKKTKTSPIPVSDVLLQVFTINLHDILLYLLINYNLFY